MENYIDATLMSWKIYYYSKPVSYFENQLFDIKSFHSQWSGFLRTWFSLLLLFVYRAAVCLLVSLTRCGFVSYLWDFFWNFSFSSLPADCINLPWCNLIRLVCAKVFMSSKVCITSKNVSSFPLWIYCILVHLGIVGNHKSSQSAISLSKLLRISDLCKCYRTTATASGMVWP